MQIRGTWSAGPGDDQARFLADLRALRDSAAIGYDELAARAHFPSDIMKEAENGPGLPTLPILTAYVRACEGDVLDWEERWRRLNPEVPDDPDLPVRPAGASAAAVAGARAGVGVAPPDVHDPERIRAALRGEKRSGQASRRASDAGVSASGVAGLGANATGLESLDQGPPADSGASSDGWGANSGWDATPDPGVTSANGNHSAKHGTRGPFDAAVTSIPDAAEPAGPAPAEEFSWLQQGQPEAQPADNGRTWPEQAGNDRTAEPANGRTWPEQAGNGRTAEPADGRFSWSEATDTGSAGEPADSDMTWPERTDTGQATPLAAGLASPEADITERIPRHQADELASQDRTDFWAKPTPPAQADLRLPAAEPRAEDPAIARTSWPATADTTSPAADPARPSATAAASPLSSAQPLGKSASTAQAAASDRDSRRQDRFFTVRLLLVIVIAALIGSALVLLLK